jgi:hypothetical protein
MGKAPITDPQTDPHNPNPIEPPEPNNPTPTEPPDNRPMPDEPNVPPSPVSPGIDGDEPHG